MRNSMWPAGEHAEDSYLYDAGTLVSVATPVVRGLPLGDKSLPCVPLLMLFTGIVVLSFLLNLLRQKKIGWKEQVIMVSALCGRESPLKVHYVAQLSCCTKTNSHCKQPDSTRTYVRMYV